MKHLGTRALLAVGGVLVILGGAAFVGYGLSRFSAVEAEATHYGTAVANALGTALSAEFEHMSIDQIRHSVESAGRSPFFDTVVVVGRSGKIVAAEPPLPNRPDPRAEARCNVCHRGSGAPRDLSGLVEGEDGERVVRLFRRLERIPACIGCHETSDEPLGYLLMEVPVTAAFERLRREVVQVLGFGFLTIVLLLGVCQGVLRSILGKPLERLRHEVERFETGDTESLFTYVGDDELGQLVGALATASRDRHAVLDEISTLARHLQARGLEAQLAFGRLREGISGGKGSAEGILASVQELDRSLGETRAHLDAIARSTSDNSASLVEMTASIDEVAASAEQVSDHVVATATSVDQMVTSISEVTESVEGLAGETDATVSSMSQIDASTRQIEENAREAAQLSGRMAEAAREGSRDVQETLSGIHASYEVIRETAHAMAELTEGNRAIGGVVKIINEINDKTKLLALNAAIIAAQAGEHGKSFAVVANEIQNLSDRTALSTGEISRIIQGIQERTSVATAAVSKGEEATARSVELADRAGGTLKKILETARVSNDMTLEILRATEEQSRGSQNVMASMQQVSAMVVHIRHAAHAHRASGETVGNSTAVMRELTEQVRFATAEQADVSRYISDAISAIDRNLRELIEALELERDETRKIMEHLGRWKDRTEGQESGVQDVEAVVLDLQTQIEGLEARASGLVGGKGKPTG